MIVLASKSPRRKELLANHGYEFVVHPADIDESKFSIEEVAYEKGKKVAEIYPNDIVISADTYVTLNGKILGKPKDKNDAYKMLKDLSGKMHLVVTYYCFVIKSKNVLIQGKSETKVYMTNFSDELINNYIASGSPLDKAGSYGIQDNDIFHIIDHIEGNYSNVVGLPIEDVSNVLDSLFLKYKNR